MCSEQIWLEDCKTFQYVICNQTHNQCSKTHTQKSSINKGKFLRKSLYLEMEYELVLTTL